MKPKYALIGVNPKNMEVCFLAGWVIGGLLEAADDGLMMVRTSWEKMEKITLYSKITEREFMELSE